MLKPEITELLRQVRRQLKRRKRRTTRVPKWLYPNGVAMTYSATLAGLVKNIQAQVEAKLLPELADMLAKAAGERPDSASLVGDAEWDAQLDRIIEAITVSLDKPGLGFVEVDAIPLATEIARRTDDFNKKQWRKVTRAVVGVELVQSEPWLKNEIKRFAAENAKLIKSIKDQGVERVAYMTRRGINIGLRHEVIAKKIRSTYNVTKRRAKVIGRDQVSKINGDLTRLRQTNAGIESYIWRTSGDRRVRPTHRDNEGERFRWDRPPATTGHPGEDVLCRCTAEAVFPDEFLE